MSSENLDRLAQLALAARSRRRRDFAYSDAVEAALLREMAKRNQLSMRLHGCMFRAVPAKVSGTPSQRRKWRAQMPEGALPRWQMPRELEITYPIRKDAA